MPLQVHEYIDSLEPLQRRYATLTAMRMLNGTVGDYAPQISDVERARIDAKLTSMLGLLAHN